MIVSLCLLLALSTWSVHGLDNGLALTPPMGWMSWQRFRCIVDCVNYPNDCISDKLFRRIADRMAADGYLEAGYEYLIIDDCWLSRERDSEGRLQPDPDRFPNGIKDLADYIHSKGLKFGIYEDIGTYTCAGYPGSGENMELDANTFAEWGADYLKLDGCYQDTEGMEEKYGQMSVFLNQTGRPIVFSCSFPAYKGLNANYTAAVEYCNLWRNYGDIEDSWGSVQNIANWFGTNQGFLNKYAGPGHWNDADMLLVGNFGLSMDESIAQMTIWSILTGPLLMSVDLDMIETRFRDVLLNKDAISVNQDPLGIPGLLSWNKNNVQIWVKPMLPEVDEHRSYAFGIVNFQYGGGPSVIEIKLTDFGLDNPNGYTQRNAFEPTDEVTVMIDDPIKISVNPSGGVLLIFNPVAA